MASSDGDPVIRVEQVSKRFLLGRARNRDLRDMFVGLSPRRGSGKNAAVKLNTERDFWAVRDISFTVEPGTALGIVGHNGSGKSTMLKLLTGILKPTEGSIRTRGRIGALIEVGAGFHPEMSGRENVYLNGSLLGLSRREIDARFDQIVDFSGLEKFIDEPVKRYSSGMYMRLGFSIAAHVDPDVLLVDEVLAVGDQLFQNKCLRRIKEYVAGGGTVVFVSHAMGQVAALCPRCVWLDHGELKFDGPTAEAVAQYHNMVAQREDEEFKRSYPEEWEMRERERQAVEAEAHRLAEEEELAARHRIDEARHAQEQRRRDPDQACITSISMLDANGRAASRFTVGVPLRIRIGYRFGRQRLPDPVLTLQIVRKDNGMIPVAINSRQQDTLSLNDVPDEGHLTLDVPMLSLNEGDYQIRLQLFPDYGGEDYHKRLEPVDRLDDAFEFRVDGGIHAHGYIYFPVQWGVEGGTSPAGESSASPALSPSSPQQPHWGRPATVKTA